MLKPKPTTVEAPPLKGKELEKTEVTEEKTKPVVTSVQKPKSSLFDEDDDEDLFKDTSKKSEATTIPEIKEEAEVKQPSKTKGKNLLFDPMALKSSGLFNKLSENTRKDKSDDESLEPNPRKESLDDSKKSNVIKEIPKEEFSSKKSTLFDDADEDDLFNVVKSLPKKEIPNNKQENLFEEPADKKEEKPTEKKVEETNVSNILNEEKEMIPNKPIVIKTNPAKKSLFDNSSDEEEEDALFSSKKQTPKVTQQPKQLETKEVISNKMVIDTIFEPEKTLNQSKKFIYFRVIFKRK